MTNPPPAAAASPTAGNSNDNGVTSPTWAKMSRLARTVAELMVTLNTRLPALTPQDRQISAKCKRTR